MHSRAAAGHRDCGARGGRAPDPQACFLRVSHSDCSVESACIGGLAGSRGVL